VRETEREIIHVCAIMFRNISVAIVVVYVVHINVVVNVVVVVVGVGSKRANWLAQSLTNKFSLDWDLSVQTCVCMGAYT